MEFRTKIDGTKIYTNEFKKQIMEELAAGHSHAELARKYGIPSQNILKWKKKLDLVQNGGAMQTVEPTIPLAEFKKLLEENKQLKRSLANMTVDRDILKEAVDIATKKKWI